MKKIFIGIGLLAVFIIGVGIYVASNLGSIVKAAIEEYGSQAAGAPVTVGSVDIELDQGSAAIHTLSLGNPPGFNASSAFDMGRISVTLAPDWKQGDTIVIDEIMVDKPKVTYELAEQGSNFDILKANMQKAAGDSSKTGSDAQSKESQSKESQSKESKVSVIINNFRLQNGEIAATAPILGGKTLSLPLPNLHLTDIGKDKGGIGPDEVAQKILSALESNVTKSVTNLDFGVVGDAAKAAKEKIGAITEGVTDRVDEMVGGDAGAAADAIGKNLDKNLDDAGNAVKSLFGN